MEDYEKAAHCRDRERELYDSTPNKIIEAFNADLQFIANNTASSVDISSRTASITHSDKNLVNVRNLLLYYQTLRTNKINQILKNNE